MVLFCWFEEKADYHAPSCKVWFPIVVIEASNEKEAWEELYKYNKTIWWTLQGETNYRPTKEAKDEEGSTNLPKELYDTLKSQQVYKTKQAQEPVIHGKIVTKKSNY